MWHSHEVRQVHSDRCFFSMTHTHICIRRTCLHPNTSRRLTTSTHSGHHNGVNSQLMETAAHRHRASGYNHDHSATDNNDSTVTTTEFSVTIVVATRSDEHLVPGYHIVLLTTPNVEQSILSQNDHVTHSALCTIIVVVQFLHPAATWINSPGVIVTRV